MKRSSPKPSGKKLYSTAEDVLKFYGSPTICKKEVPLRSVVSSTGSSPLIGKTEHNVKNSMDLLKELTVCRYPFGQIAEAVKQIIREREC